MRLAPRAFALAALSRRAVAGWVADSAPSMGAALAFYTLLSLAPLLLVAVGLAGFFLGRDAAQDALIRQLALVLGDDAAVGVETLLDVAGARGQGLTPALVGAVTMFVGATTVFAELRSDLDRIWRCRPGHAAGILRYLGARAAAFLLVVAIGLLLAGSMLASTFLATAGAQVFPGSTLSLHALEFATSFVGVTLLFAAIYKLLPSRPVAWSDVWAGAAVTSLLFWVGKFLIALYISKTAVASTFGAAGAVVAVVLWVYYSAQVFFLGAEFTREHALAHGSRRGDAAAPPGLAAMNADYEELARRTRRLTSGA